MWREAVAVLIILFSTGCGETAPKPDEYSKFSQDCLIIQPSNPPFIEFNNSNLGQLDDFTYDEDVEFTLQPISQPPNIF